MSLPINNIMFYTKWKIEEIGDGKPNLGCDSLTRTFFNTLTRPSFTWQYISPFEDEGILLKGILHLTQYYENFSIYDVLGSRKLLRESLENIADIQAKQLVKDMMLSVFIDKEKTLQATSDRTFYVHVFYEGKSAERMKWFKSSQQQLDTRRSLAVLELKAGKFKRDILEQLYESFDSNKMTEILIRDLGLFDKWRYAYADMMITNRLLAAMYATDEVDGDSYDQLMVNADSVNKLICDKIIEWMWSHFQADKDSVEQSIMQAPGVDVSSVLPRAFVPLYLKS